MRASGGGDAPKGANSGGGSWEEAVRVA